MIKSKMSPSINYSVFLNLKESMGELMPELIRIFIEDSELLIKQIQTNIACNDLEHILFALHTLKSSAKNIGADRFATSCIDMENNIRDKMGFDLNNQFDDISFEMRDVKSELSSFK